MIIGKRYHQQVIEWQNRMEDVTFGYGSPSPDRTLEQHNEFCIAGEVGTWLNYIVSCNTLPPDEFLRLKVPLIGTAPGWTFTNFVAGDFTVNGLKGDASTKYADSGYIPNTTMSSGSGGVICYVYDFVVSTGGNCGCGLTTDGTRSLLLHVTYTDSKMYSDVFNRTVNNVTATNTAWQGYIISTRVSVTDHRVFKANSVTAHAQLGSTNTTNFPVTVPDRTVYWWGYHSSTPILLHSGRYSFCACHNGLTSAQSSSLFNAIQRLRQEMGGGYR